MISTSLMFIFLKKIYIFLLLDLFSAQLQFQWQFLIYLHKTIIMRWHAVSYWSFHCFWFYFLSFVNFFIFRNHGVSLFNVYLFFVWFLPSQNGALVYCIIVALEKNQIFWTSLNYHFLYKTSVSKETLMLIFNKYISCVSQMSLFYSFKHSKLVSFMNDTSQNFLETWNLCISHYLYKLLAFR